MKKASLFMACLLMGICLVGCSNDKTDDPTPGPVTTKFSVEIQDLKHNELSVTIVPPTDNPVYYVRLFPDSQDLAFDNESLAQAILNSGEIEEYTQTGTQTLTYQGLIGHSHYCLLYFAWDATEEKMLSKLFRTARITTPDAPKEFAIEVTDITGLSANISITPPDNSTYYWFAEEKNTYLTQFEDNDYLLIQNDFAYWQFMASMYEDVSWQEVMRLSLYSGPTTEHSDDFYSTLRWDTEYIAYAYGLDNDGNLTTPITKETFRTNTPTPSDLTFEVEFDPETDIVYNPEKQGFYINATIIPSNQEESYYVTVTNKDWYDWYFTPENDQIPTDDASIIYEIICNQPNSTKALEMCMSGTQEFSTKDYMRGHKPLKEYAFFIFGLTADGATTGLTVVPFTTPEMPKEEVQ